MYSRRFILIMLLTAISIYSNAQEHEDTSSLVQDEEASGLGVSSVASGLRIPDDDDLVPDRIYEPDRTSADSAPVGGPSVAFSVSGTGAATYTIPIELPKGINGMEPEVSLVYNSQGGNDVAGWGFGLSCMSSISFVPNDIYHDDVAGPLHYDWRDSLALDGRRLILESGIHGEQGAAYSLEGDPYTTVTLKTDASTGKPYFLVEKPDGMRLYYGRGTSLYTLDIGGEEHVVGWYVSACFDRHNTPWSYTYTHTGNGMLLNGVYYDDKVVSIIYESRANDPQSWYVGDVKVTLDKRIKTIRVKRVSSTDIYRAYTLSYDTTSDQSGTKYSRLVSVTESNGEGESRKPVVIEWENLPGFGMTPGECQRDKIYRFNLSDDVKGRCYNAADLNNDGISDLIYLYQGKDPLQGSDNDYTFLFIFLSNVVDGNIEYGYKRTFRTEPGFSFNKVKGYVSSLTPMDIDGDGLCDLCLTNVDKLGYGLNITQYTVLTGDTINNSSDLHVNPQIAVHNFYTGDAPLLTMSDYDHDGKTEIIHLETGKTGGVYKAYYLANSDTLLLGATPFSVTLPSDPKHTFSGDFNNDGLADLAVFCVSGYKVFLNQGEPHGTCPFSDASSYAGADINYRKRMVQGDFNGDGLPDFLMNGKESKNYYIVSCNGDGTFTQSPAIQLGLYEQDTDRDDNRMCLIPLNLDHDGKTDILLGKANFHIHGGLSSHAEFTDTEFRWLRSTGSGFELVRKTRTTNLEDARPSFILTGDFSGNGQTELMNYGGDIYSPAVALNAVEQAESLSASADSLAMEDNPDSLEDVSVSLPKARADDAEASIMASSSSSVDVFHIYRQTDMTAGKGRVKKATDSFGNVTTPTYAYLTNGGVYTAWDDSSYPVNDMTVPLSVVSGYSETGGAAGEMRKTLAYGGLKGQVAGKGLLGFQQTTLRDLNTGSVTETVLSGLDPNYFEPTLRQTTTMAGGFSSMSSEACAFSTVRTNHILLPTSSMATDVYGNETMTWYTYDAESGTLTREYTEYDGDEDMSREKTYQYTPKGGAYRPIQVLCTEMHPDSPGEPWQTKQVSTYNNYGELLTTTEHANTALSRTTTYTYDGKGNVLTKCEQTGTDKYLTTSYTYADYRTLMSSSTIPASSTHTYTYDQWSRPLTHTETYGDTILTTVNVYDPWGNLASTTSPDGVTTTYTRGWGTTAAKRYYVLEERQGAPWVKTWYDSRGREVLTESVGPAHVRKDHHTCYDSKGQVVLRKDHLGIRLSADTLSYDTLGRVIAERHTAGNNTFYSYGDRTVTAVTNGVTLTKTMDAWGNVRQAVENGTAVSYSYAPNGKPKSVTSCGHTTTLAYDEVGNRTSLTDPDAGTSTWEYDNCGRVTKHTDARGKVTQAWYDEFGNKERETADGIQMKYYYDTPRRHVVRETGGGHICSIRYDTCGRLKSSGKYMYDGLTTLFKHYVYDTMGRVKANGYTHCPNVIYTRDEYGFLTAVSVSGKTVWRQVDFTGKSEICKALEDSIQVVRRYDNAGRMTRMVRTCSHEGISIYNWNDSITYTYDPATSNLTGMTKGLSLTQTVYAYDSLDRLVSTGMKSHNGKTSVTQTVVYGADGNILSKTGLGDYSYSTAKPHAVTAVENTDGVIPQTAQSVSFNAYGKVSRLESDGYRLDIDYGTDHERWQSTLTDDGGDTLRVTRYAEDMDIVKEDGSTRIILYLDGGVVCVREKDAPTDDNRFYYMHTDRLGSVLDVVEGDGNVQASWSYDAWGNPGNWTANWFPRGYTGHEMLPEFGLINMNGRMYDPVLGRFLSPDDYVQMPHSPQGFNRYAYCMNNPLKYTDPSGEIFTWNIGKKGFSFGFNFTPFGIPLGFGLNVGYADGPSYGGYLEVGYRVGGTGFGSGLTLSQSFDYNVGHNSWSTTTSGNLYGSLGAFNAGADISQTYNFSNHKWTNGWNVGVGLGFGNEQQGIGLNVGYGSGGWAFGIGGFYDSHAWDDNPTYEPSRWNDDNYLRSHNNCYSYALDDIYNGHKHGLQPGGGLPNSQLYLDEVYEASLSDGRIKKPTFLNKLGFGKKGYYPVYLVIDNEKDYHWYRQDKGGHWSHKPGEGKVTKYDASHKEIRNPAKANHNYDPDRNYTDGAMLLWVRRR